MFKKKKKHANHTVHVQKLKNETCSHRANGKQMASNKCKEPGNEERRETPPETMMSWKQVS